MKVWREVTHIDIHISERGWRVWRLKLSCGHMAFRRIPRLRLHNLTNFKRIEAPEKCHCHLCEYGNAGEQKNEQIS